MTPPVASSLLSGGSVCADLVAGLGIRLSDLAPCVGQCHPAGTELCWACGVDGCAHLHVPICQWATSGSDSDSARESIVLFLLNENRDAQRPRPFKFAE